jgi:hypothetical protein
MVRLTSTGTTAARPDEEKLGAELHVDQRALLRGRLLEYLRSSHIAPALTCLAVAFVIALAPILYGYMRTGTWIYISLYDSDGLYYLSIAAQTYYGHSFLISDPAVSGGVTPYAWSQFVPPVLVLRALGLNIFSFTLLWDFCAAIGISLSLYILYWHFLRRRWLAAAAAIFSLAYYGLCSTHPLLDHSRLLGAILGHRIGLLGSETLGHLPPALLSGALWLRSLQHWATIPQMQWRTPDPALDLPLLFFLAVVVSLARERRSARTVAASGAVFGALFYVYFYAWTLAGAALCIAFPLDRAARRVYLNIFIIGLVVGLPALVHDFYVSRLASAEALSRFWFLPGAPARGMISMSDGSILVLCVLGYWIWRNQRYDLIYLWSLAVAGVLLTRQSLVTGIFIHDFHWQWLWPPFRTILLVIVLTPFWRSFLRRRAILCAASVAMLVYIGFAPKIFWTISDPQLRDAYIKYQAQRMQTRNDLLAPGSMIAGEETFCELAAVAEDQRALASEFLASSLAVDDASWVAREALSAVLRGSSRARFADLAPALTQFLWSTQQRRDAETSELLRSFDEFSRDPTAAADSWKVRYVAIPTAEPPPAYLRSGWNILEAGPYWQIWQRNVASDGTTQKAFF